MKSNARTAMSVQHILTPLLGAILAMAVLLEGKAAGHSEFVMQLTGRAVDVSSSENAGRIDILIQRWSTDEELQRFREAAPRQNQLELLSLLHHTQRRIGVILMPGVQAHGARARLRTPRNVLFAREVTTPAGRRIIAASDEHLGLGEPSIEARRSQPEFNLIDIRFEADGRGVGKIAAINDVTFSTEVGLLEVKDYRKHPARLVDVREEQQR